MSDFMEIVRQKQFEHFMGRTGGISGKRKKSYCAICKRGMESPSWEEGPKYCYKCSDKHEIGNPNVN